MSADPIARSRVGVIGAGRYGLALAAVMAGQGREVTLFTSLKARADALRTQRALPAVLPELERLPDSVEVTTSPEELAESCTLLLMTSSSEYFDGLAAQVGPHLDGAHCVVHACHVLQGSSLDGGSSVVKRHSVVRQVGVIAGPMHVSELLAGQPNAAVVGSAYPLVHALVRDALHAPHVRIHASWDVRGVEMAAALAQVVALGTGLADGREMGAAVHASLMTLGLAEMVRIGTAVDVHERTFMGLAGVGRLVDAIRRSEPNYQLGLDLASADDRPAVLASAPPDALGLQVVRSLRTWAESHTLQLPFVEHLGAILDGTEDVEPGIRALLRDVPMPS